MNYRATTPKQRDRMYRFLEQWRSGRISFIGPRPLDGMICVSRTLPGQRDVYFIDRDGDVKNAPELGWPRLSDFDRTLAANYG